MGKKKKRKPYRIVGAFDTETTNIGAGLDTIAFTNLYIYNDLTQVDLYTYEPDKLENIIYIREQPEFLKLLNSVINYASSSGFIPIICAYNLGFDIQTIVYELSQAYELTAVAQNSTTFYTIDVLNASGETVLRFWDMWHLEPLGLAAMGQAAGLPKAVGDWDYDLIRTPETPLTDLELFYAKRDVQVLPAYLKYLLHAIDWLREEDLGVKVLTKTSLVRQMGQNVIGHLKAEGLKTNLYKSYLITCANNKPLNYTSYATRKACFRGGFVFVAGEAANNCSYNNCSIDVTSMHHAFINGREVPVNFKEFKPEFLQEAANAIIDTDLKYVLDHYHKPLNFAIHASITFKNLRLKENSIFEKYQIALIPRGKFGRNAVVKFNKLNETADELTRAQGFYDTAKNPLFAFSKLYAAEEATLFLNELELWNIAQVYEWDDMAVNFGEIAWNFRKPPDYVTLQSQTLYELKNDVKNITKYYREGEPYKEVIPDFLPIEMRESLRAGTCTQDFLESYYKVTIKGMFNSISGTQAQDIFKPDYMCTDGEFEVDPDTKTTPLNFDEKNKERSKVFYNYGMRIVGGSRMHLLIAMILLDRALGDRIFITSGDTDSLKISCAGGLSDEEILNALKPLHSAIRTALKNTQAYTLARYPKNAAKLDGVGEFEVEGAGDGSTRYLEMFDSWNKNRASLDSNYKVHLTFAGIPRPTGFNTVETWLEDYVKQGATFEEACKIALGYNVNIPYDLAHFLGRIQPNADSVLDLNITDYLGEQSHIRLPEAVALYPQGKIIGDPFKSVNLENIRYLANKGEEVDISTREIYYEGDIAKVRYYDSEL